MYKKVDRIEYKGYEIPVYSDGKTKFVGHPYKIGEIKNINKIYDIDNISKLKDVIFLKSKGKDIDFPLSIGTVKVKEKTNSLLNIFKNLMNESEDKNFKPSYEFDLKYNTNLSRTYDLSPYTDDEIWERWVNFSVNQSLENKKKFLETFKVISKAFPYVDVEKYDNNTKKDIMLGMVSSYNPDDIIHFSINKIYGFLNHEQKALEKELPKEIVKDIQWVLSPSSIKIIRERFGII